MTKLTKTEEEILKEFDKQFPQLENYDFAFQATEPDRNAVKSFLLSSLRKQREEVLKEAVEVIEKTFECSGEGDNEICEYDIEKALKSLKKLK